MKDFDNYQEEAKRTCPLNIDLRDRFLIGALGTAGEAGEIVETIKKSIFHGHELDTKKLAREIGDVMWYLANLATAIGFNLSEVAQMNVDKLRVRYPAGFSHEASKNRKEEGE